MPLLQVKDHNFVCDAVLLDKDGTLIDFKTMWLQWSMYIIDNIMASVKKSSLSRPVLEQAMGVDLTNWLVHPGGALAHGDMAVIQNQMAQVLIQKGINSAEADQLIQQVVTQSETAVNWGALAQPVQGIKEKLRHLHQAKFKLAVVTADSTDRALISLQATGLVDYFDDVIGADLVEQTKPAPDMTFLACQKLNLDPAQAVVVGDSPNDIAMAKAAGAGSIGVLSGVSTSKQLVGADVIIKSVAELGVGS